MNSGWSYEDEDLHEIVTTGVAVPEFVVGSFNEPEVMDARRWFREENQLSLLSCNGFGGAGAAELAFRIATGGRELIQFSPAWCYYEAQRIGNLLSPRSGSRLADLLRVMKTLGIATEPAWPYRSVWDPTRPAGVLANAAQYKVGSHAVLRSFSQVEQYLASGQGGVWIGCASAAFHPTAPGILEVFQRGNGGHAVCVLGYTGRRDPQGRRYLQLHNSGYPTPGWYESSPRWWDAAFRQPDTVVIGISDLSTPRPRAFPWGKTPVLA